MFEGKGYWERVAEVCEVLTKQGKKAPCSVKALREAKKKAEANIKAWEKISSKGPKPAQ